MDSQLAVKPHRAESVPDTLRAVLSASDYGILLTDQNHAAVVCNRRFGELWGVNIEKAVQADPGTLHKMVEHRLVDKATWLANLESLHADAELEQLDELVLTDPPAVLRRFTGPVRILEGQPRGRLWTFQDVTAEHRRRMRREFTRAAHDVFHANPSEVYRTLASMLAEFYGSMALISIRQGDFMAFQAIAPAGCSAEGVEGNPLTDAYCQFCIERREGIIVQDANLDPATAAVLPARLGLTRYAGVPLHGPDGALLGTLCILDSKSDEPLGDEDLDVLRSLAQRISHELQREALMRALEGDLASTRQELLATQVELVRSEKLAVSGTLAASVAHDIRNILSSLLVRVKVGKDRPAETLKTVESELGRFSILAHRLLSYAKPRRINWEWLDLHDVAMAAVSLLEIQAEAAGVTLQPDLQLKDSHVQGDAARLEHLAVNLILNALQASPPGGCVTVSTALRGGVRVLEVTDQGPGIPAEVAQHIFQPFRSSRPDGFGLGLFSCHQIAESHGALLSFRPGQDRGTVFSLEWGQE